MSVQPFGGKRPIGKEVNHRDGNKRNNSASNLEWVTKSEQQKHRYEVLGHIPSRLGVKLPDELKQRVIKTLCYYGKPKDKFGVIADTRTSKAVAMYEQGATVQEVISALGGPFGAILTRLKQEGHHVQRDSKVVKLIYVAEAVKLK